jgi:hypothetical protein
MKSGKQFELPKSRPKSIPERLTNLNGWQLFGRAIGLYIIPIIICSCIEWKIGPDHLKSSCTIPAGFWDLIYFNFISMLTIGYGDLSPTGVFRVITIIEAIYGLAVYSLTISLLLIKMLLPRKDTIVFSKYGYYCVKDGAFMVIYLNTANQFITNLETSWYFKLNDDWETRIPVRVPFITKSVQTFYLKPSVPFEQINAELHPYDCLRVGLNGSLGIANYSTYVEYGIEDILIIENRNELIGYTGFHEVDENLTDAEFERLFHYKPKNARPLSDCLDSAINIHRNLRRK